MSNSEMIKQGSKLNITNRSDPLITFVIYWQTALRDEGTIIIHVTLSGVIKGNMVSLKITA